MLDKTETERQLSIVNLALTPKNGAKMASPWSRYPAGIFDADKGLESGLSVPNFQYFRSRSSLVCHYWSVIHLSLFWFMWYQTSPILGWTKTSTENNKQKIFDPKWTQKYDNVGGFKWSRFEPCPLGYVPWNVFRGGAVLAPLFCQCPGSHMLCQTTPFPVWEGWHRGYGLA